MRHNPMSHTRTATTPRSVRVSGRLRLNPRLAARVPITSSAGRLVAVLRVALWGKCAVRPITMASCQARPMLYRYLQILVPGRCQAAEDIAYPLPVSLPLCAVRHARKLRSGMTNDQHQEGKRGGKGRCPRDR